MFVKTFTMNKTSVPIEILMDDKADPGEIRLITIEALSKEEVNLTFEEVNIFDKSVELCLRETKIKGGLVFKISSN